MENPLTFIARLESSGDSIYNSLQATLKKDLSHGFQFLAAYTFAKSIDDAGDNLGAAIGGTFGLPIFGKLGSCCDPGGCKSNWQR